MVKIRILSGSRSIGGNFIRIEDGGRTLIFDQGIRFDIMSNYYSTFVTPRGIAELRNLGILPKAEWYENANGIYVSHMHLDHLGALSNIPSEIKTHLPSLPIYEDMEKRWRMSPTWLSLIPRKYYVELEELEPLETDENDVMAIPVSHSAQPAYAFLFFGKGETVLYSGDFRIESFLTEDEFFKLNNGQPLLEFLSENSDLKVNTLIIEGTNMGSSRVPLSPKSAIETIKRLTANNKLVITTLHGLDLEYTLTLMKLATELNFNCCVTSKQTAKLLEKVSNLPVEPRLVEGYIDYLAPFEKISLNEVEDNTLLLASYREFVDLLKDLNSAGCITSSSVAIMSEPEPETEEAIEYGVVANWLSKMGVQFYRIRVSGHYYPYQLKRILNTIKPDKKIVVHTIRPNLFYNLIKNVSPVS